MNAPPDYLERVYAGVLGKLIGVYLGRPVEGWSYEKISQKYGQIDRYIHDSDEQPLIVTDDDIAGTFIFPRALSDHKAGYEITSAQIGQTWLNYLIENRSVLWWGGLGNSTEHTAYLRLKNGIPAPQSGSMETNGKVIAEQIGAQIFIDAWAMTAPGDAELAAHLAQRAARVSHDGEAVYAAQALAAMQAHAFIESDIEKLMDVALALIPADSQIFRLAIDIRTWFAQGLDWRVTRERIAEKYGYDKYGGIVPVVPNHGLILLGLLYGEDDFQKSLRIVNTCGWDTDCNSGNLGCLLGIKNGLAGINRAPGFREPVADRLYLSSADGGRAISDAVIETYEIVNTQRRLTGKEESHPKNGARFHFELPGAVQGFQPAKTDNDILQIENIKGYSHLGKRCLAIHYSGESSSKAARIATPTFIPPEAVEMEPYDLLASPTLYAGQIIQAQLSSDTKNQNPFTCSLFVQYYDGSDRLTLEQSPDITLNPGEAHHFVWQVTSPSNLPIAEVGIQIQGADQSGTLYLDYLSWDGMPSLDLTRPAGSGQMWRRAWVNGVDILDTYSPDAFRLVQNEGVGLFIYGTREWSHYEVCAWVQVDMAKAVGLAVLVQGMRRYYALLLSRDGKARLVKVFDDQETVLAEADIEFQFGKTYKLCLSTDGNFFAASIGDRRILTATDPQSRIDGGGAALVCEEGCLSSDRVTVKPLTQNRS